MRLRTTLHALAALTLAALLASPSSAGDARALDDHGRVLTVGNWALVTLDGGLTLRVADGRFLGWELRDQDGSLLAQGLVPGTENVGVDASPSLSRNPLTGELWLAWSRQASLQSAREIAIGRFVGDAWDAGGPTIVATDSDDQAEPTLVHDETGRAWLAWTDGLVDRTIRFMGLAADLRSLGTLSLSDGLSSRNGAPNLGIDALGGLFVAYAGTDNASGEVRLFVHSANPIRGGVSHVPNPLIELGLRATLPSPSIGVTGPAGAPAVPTRVELTVLGGTPVAWWTENAGGELARFRYAAATTDGWDTSIRTIDMQGGMVTSVPDALALVEARLRRVVDQLPGGPQVPVMPGRIGRDLVRR